MKTLNIFGTPSIRRRISAAFLIMILFVVVMVAASYFQLRQIKPSSDLIVQDSEELVEIQRLSTAISALDADLERFLTLRSVEYRESVEKNLQEMTDVVDELREDPDTTQELKGIVSELENTVAELQTQVDLLFNLVDSSSSTDINRSVISIYQNIDQAKEIQEKLSTLTLTTLQTSAQTQGLIAGNVLTQSVILGIVIILIAVITTVVTDRRLRTISTLTNTAAAITAGDLSRVAPVESNDEIGTLAGAFNSMTTQLRQTLEGLEQRVADRTKALATSTEVSRRISTILDQKELVTEVVNQVKDAFGYYHAQIYFYNEANDSLVMAGGTGEAGEKMLAQFHKVAKGRGLVGRAAEINQVVLVSDTAQDSEWLPNKLLPETKSEVAIPISIGDQVLGVLDVQHNIADGVEDVDALQSIANQVAVALQNIRQYEKTRKIAADMGVVANVGIATSTITDAGHMLQAVADLSKESFNLYHAHIYLLNEAGNLLELASGAGEVGRQMVSEKRSISLDSEQSLVARAARTREGVVVNDVTTAPDFLPNPLLPDTRSEMAVPMLVAGKVIGVLDVQSETTNRFTDVDVSIQTTLASQVAVALQNARSFSQTQQQAERQTTLNIITQKIQNATSIEAALQVAARELGHALGMKSTLVTLDPKALAGEQKVIAHE